jgi:hypothetical protein
VEQAQPWANMVAEYYKLTPRRRGGNGRCDGSSPRIGILNRAKSRTIQHVDQLAAAMGSNINGTTGTDIVIQYFENASFIEQVQFFIDTDILISPHGAQLTGIPFLTASTSSPTTSTSSMCSQVMEIFPPSYVLTDFFGTLAAQSHIPHSYMYFEPKDSNDDNDNFSSSPLVLPGAARVSRTVTERKVDRQRSIQIVVDDVVKAVQSLVEDWYMCCRQSPQWE